MSEFPSLESVLDDHQPDRVDRGVCDECGVVFSPQHQADAWRAACEVRTVEQLDALPEGAVVLSPGKPDEFPELGTYGSGAWTRGDDDKQPWYWWAMDYGEPASEIGLPALLIHHPDWARP